MEVIKYIVMNDLGIYQYPRQETGLMYIQRTAYGPDPTKARLFNNKSAAKNSINYNRGSRYWKDIPKGLKVRKVKVTYELVEE